MNLAEFLNKYTGKKVDFDKVYGAQCVDLFRRYCQDVWQIPHTGGVEDAKDLWLNYDKMPGEKEYLSKVTGLPAAGDVVVFNATKTNKYGHVAIFLGAIDYENILVFEQDGFKQDGAKYGTRGFDNILGFFRKK